MEIVTQPDANEINLEERLHPTKCDKNVRCALSKIIRV